MFRRLRPIGVLTLISTLMVVLVPLTTSAKSDDPVVMTRNLYLGGDIGLAIGASDPQALTVAAADIYLSVVSTDFNIRAAQIAEEIESASPDLIGLQEVALWESGDFGDTAPADTVEFDYLEILLDALADLGLGYSPAVVQNNFSAEVPASFSSGGFPVLRDVRLTQRNVILVKDGISYANVQSEHFETNQVYPNIGGIPGNDLVDMRGWVSIDVEMASKNRHYRFVNTHLESFVAPVRDIQAQELVDGPLSTNLKVVAVGDFNSPPTGPESGAYQILTRANNGKMRDAWVGANGSDPGFTCCQAANLKNSTDETDTRIDLILTKTPAIRSLEASLTGTSPPSPGGLWNSDHHGVVARLRVP